tara:strand:+ start:125851 stop:127251 length:1401 start_codon:yes stop_codon:yes gene_type:complete
VAFAVISAVVSCNTAPKPKLNDTQYTYYYDLDSILKNKKLTVLMEYSSTGYFIYKGVPMGFEYDILNNYCKHLNVSMNVVPIHTFATVFDDLNSGKGDIIAANLTITKERTKKAAFTIPHTYTRQVLVQRKHSANDSTPFIHSPLELAHKHIVTHKNTSFYERLVHLSEEIGAPIYIDTASPAITSEELIDKVAMGEINFTVADENVAKVLQHFYPNIDISVPLSMKQKIAFAVRKNSRKLLTNYNLWFNRFKKTRKYKYLLQKYFNNRSFYASMYNSDYYFPETGRISPFDDLIKRNAQKIGWDWELLASMIYQESHFNPKAKSWAGAFGLMQLMPNTAKRYGIDSTSSPAEQIAAGVKFLQYLDKQWAKTVHDSIQRQKFVLASYNVGLGHIIDARNLAKKYGANPTVWDNNVEYYIKLKSKPKYYKDEVVKHGYCRGMETYLYVRKVWERYIHYKNFTKKFES